MIIKRIKSFTGETHLRGDKSISHRAAMFAAIGEGTSTIRNYSSGKDCRSTLDCLNMLGILSKVENGIISITGNGKNGFRRPSSILDAGNSGTTIRLLSGILAGQRFMTVISGDASIQKRPMKRIIDPLSSMNAEITGTNGGFPPLNISGGNLLAIDFIPPVPSAQVKSCVLLAGMYADGKTSVTERVQTRNHTEVLLGLDAEETETGSRIIMDPDRLNIPGREYFIPGDISSAYFLILPAILSKNGRIVIKNVGLNPTRTVFLNLLQNCGARIIVSDIRFSCGESYGTIIAESSELKQLYIDSSVVPSIIDEVPLLAVLAAVSGMKLTLTDAKELRVKESDRIKAIVTNLYNFGAEITELENGFVIKGRRTLKGTKIESFNDHRIAMAMTVAGLFAEGETHLPDPETASISFPEFFSVIGEMSS